MARPDLSRSRVKMSRLSGEVGTCKHRLRQAAEDDTPTAEAFRLTEACPVRDAMPALFDLLESEAEPSVRAVLGHWLFGYIHPYMDGNGRMARFLMNTMLASGGYPWSVVRVKDRARYLHALDSASIDLNIEPFAAFLAVDGASAYK
jgi:Fic family protein